VWGKNWDHAWFHLTGSVPIAWKGKKICARINLGSEALIFSKNGTPIYGLSVASLWPTQDFKRERFDICQSARGGEVVELWIEASAAQLFGLQLMNDEGKLAPRKYGHYEACVKTIELTVFRKDIWDFYLDCTLLNDQMRALPPNSVRRARILFAVNRAIDHFHDDEESIRKAKKWIHIELTKKNSASSLQTIAVGHAHLDTAWLWPVNETIRKCARTFANQVDLIERYPDYIFGASQAQHYQFVKKYYPALYTRIKQKVQEGKWEIQGGMWVEADCNLISGESMVRQILHGKNFFRGEFNVDVKNLWLPDVFGYSDALPQILKKSGIQYFVSQKLSWNQYNRFPHHTFLWRGIDGSEIITHFPPEENYASELKPSGLMKGQDHFIEKGFLNEYLTLFGIGDGGGGPTMEMIESGLRQRDLEGSPKVILGHAQDMLSRLDSVMEKLPIWVGELYFELHRGTYTTHAYIKKMNRKMEFRLREIEMLYSLAPSNTVYPGEELDCMWKRLLLNQFHDIIPGSSITPVYEDSRKDYQVLQRQSDDLIKKFIKKNLTKVNHRFCIINTLSTTYNRPVVLPMSWAQYDILNEDGAIVPYQIEEDCTVVLVPIRPLSYITLNRGSKHSEKRSTLSAQDTILENELIRYTFFRDGTLSKAYDKSCKREIIIDGQLCNSLRLFEDRPVNWDAWDIDIYYEKQFLEQAHLIKHEWLCQGPIRQGIRFHYKIGQSTILQDVYLAVNSKRLDFKTQIDWQECHKLLRVFFEVDIQSDLATYEIQFGHMKRPTHRNTSWDMAQFEVIGHRYADLSEEGYGVAILNDCKYGYQIHHNVMSLSLLRAPTVPDPTADRGVHHFTYSFLPHRGRLIESHVLSETSQLNQGILCFPGQMRKEMLFPCSLDTDDVVLDTIKKAENDDSMILRFYEPMGRRIQTNLNLHFHGVDLFETDLMEENEKKLDTRENMVKLKFEPFEIKTIKITGWQKKNHKGTT